MKRFARMTACCIAVLALQSAALAATIPDRMNLELVGHSTLNGAGKGGEGLALKQYGSRKILFLAHESGPLCFQCHRRYVFGRSGCFKAITGGSGIHSMQFAGAEWKYFGSRKAKREGGTAAWRHKNLRCH